MWSIPDQTGRTAVVTGASAGLGLATAQVLADRGATVVLACRDVRKGEGVRAALTQRGVSADRLVVRRLDLGDQASVQEFAATFRAEHDGLDLLINNAGLGGMPAGRTADNFETHIGVNHLGHMALTLRLLPVLVARPGARVVTLTSGAHRAGRIDLSDLDGARERYRPFAAYARSKLANLLFSVELGRRLSAAGHDTVSVAVDPGFVRTELNTKGSTAAQRLIIRVSQLLVPSQSATNGARTTLRAATDPAPASGQLYAPRFGTIGPPVLANPGRSATTDPTMPSRLWGASLTRLQLVEPVLLRSR
ncbi:oxidoreductase [Dactylosporangium sp. NPDC005572]|uniref:oxidoreductase n=1 Tax=Dactylosporangium sp. NPDC005572 TaxID=3156889 RepID=UPI0033A590D4